MASAPAAQATTAKTVVAFLGPSLSDTHAVSLKSFATPGKNQYETAPASEFGGQAGFDAPAPCT